MSKAEPLWDYSDTSLYVKAPAGTVRWWVHTGAIPHVRLSDRTVRFVPSEIRRWLAERSVGVAPKPTTKEQAIEDAAPYRVGGVKGR
jgi:hypothetical protein